MIKIIAGKHKNRIIPAINKASYRPSTGKFREAIFSIITSGEFIHNPVVANAQILDLFCGTGSLGFEALSRGGDNVTFVDINLDYLKAARQFAERIGEKDKTVFLHLNATILPKAATQYNLVFMDPPYYKDMVTKTINALIEGRWLQQKAILIVELAKTEDIILDEDIKLMQRRIYGNNKLLILKYEQN